MILLEPAHKILHTTVKFKRRTISVTPFFVHRVTLDRRGKMVYHPVE